jgi:hypothetical protein
MDKANGEFQKAQDLAKLETVDVRRANTNFYKSK